jgi:hypothetical protein
VTDSFIAFKTKTSDPEVLKAYQKILKDPRNSSPRAKQVQDAIEMAFGKIFGGRPRLGSERLKPDLMLSDNSFTKAVSSVLGSKVEESELKFKRGQSKKRKPTEIGKIKLTDEIKQSALGQVSAKELDDKSIADLNVNRGKELLEAIKKTSDGPEFYNKSKFLQISKMVDGKVETLNIITPASLFKVPPFIARYSRTEDSITLSLSDAFERDLINEIKQVTDITADKGIENLTKLFKDFTKTRTSLKTAQGVKEFAVTVPTGGSIPMGRARIRRTKQAKTNRKEIGRFISKEQLSVLVRQRVTNKMPKGPRRGPPLSDQVLTFRTGRFAKSVNVVSLNYKSSIIRYFYDPIYRVHEETTRDPRELIETSIREVVQRKFARQFAITRI